jgi:hypothetical protein
LIEQRKNPVAKAKGMMKLQEVANYFGLGDVAKLKRSSPLVEEYSVSSSSSGKIKLPSLSLPSIPTSKGRNKLYGSPSITSGSSPSTTSIGKANSSFPSLTVKKTSAVFGSVSYGKGGGKASFGSASSGSGGSFGGAFGGSGGASGGNGSSKVVKQTQMPSLGFGGGFDGPKGTNIFGGKWFLKRHKIKTYSQMLKTMGVGGGLGKAMQNIEKSTNRLTKNFKPKSTHNKSRRKRKR